MHATNVFFKISGRLKLHLQIRIFDAGNGDKSTERLGHDIRAPPVRSADEGTTRRGARSQIRMFCFQVGGRVQYRSSDFRSPQSVVLVKLVAKVRELRDSID